jgi:hypothetical protein
MPRRAHPSHPPPMFLRRCTSDRTSFTMLFASFLPRNVKSALIMFVWVAHFVCNRTRSRAKPQTQQHPLCARGSLEKRQPVECEGGACDFEAARRRPWTNACCGVCTLPNPAFRPRQGHTLRCLRQRCRLRQTKSSTQLSGIYFLAMELSSSGGQDLACIKRGVGHTTHAQPIMACVPGTL